MEVTLTLVSNVALVDHLFVILHPYNKGFMVNETFSLAIIHGHFPHHLDYQIKVIIGLKRYMWPFVTCFHDG